MSVIGRWGCTSSEVSKLPLRVLLQSRVRIVIKCRPIVKREGQISQHQAGESWLVGKRWGQVEISFDICEIHDCDLRLYLISFYISFKVSFYSISNFFNTSSLPNNNNNNSTIKPKIQYYLMNENSLFNHHHQREGFNFVFGQILKGKIISMKKYRFYKTVYL